MGVPEPISIVAPLTGCDAGYDYDTVQDRVFQSTHPSRGATGGAGDAQHRAQISIHAPLAGCDRFHRKRKCARLYFNPRTPCGVRLWAMPPTFRILVFQSTHPLRGATLSSPSPALPATHFNPRTPCGVRPREVADLLPGFIEISIHAPLAGCDVVVLLLLSLIGHFNARTPCGVRQQKCTNSSVYFCDKRLFLDSFTQNAAF